MSKTTLFQTGDFTLRSGKKSKYKIECDALTPEDWAGIAAAIMEEDLLPPFSVAVGVPHGGIPFAQAMKPYETPGTKTLLVCEDVVTTGGSIQRFVEHDIDESGWKRVVGVCFIARGKCPDWIIPFLQMRRSS